MDRCKLEYMIKRFDLNESKRIIREIDPIGEHKFNKDISRFLLNPETTDSEILIYVGPSHAIYYSVLETDPELAFEYKEDMDKELEEVKAEYIAQYKLINDLCIKNNTSPFFTDSTNVTECEKTRLDLVKVLPEELINKFFGVDSLRDYEPPLYKE